MLNIEESPARLFAALGDATRLGLIKRLSNGTEQSIAQLGEDLPISRQAVAKHLEVLQGVGLVRRTRRGREVLFVLEPKTVAQARRWLTQVSAQWDDALGRLKMFVESQP